VGPTAVHHGRLHGLRQWELSRDATGAIRLGAACRAWRTDGETTWAQCSGGNSWASVFGTARAHEALAPAAGCTCGLYAIHPRAAFECDFWAPLAGAEQMLAFGVVEAWGQVQLYREGFRARYARPVVLVLTGVSRRSDYGRLLEDVAIAHRAELIEVRDDTELFEHCERTAIGLSAEELDALLQPATSQAEGG